MFGSIGGFEMLVLMAIGLLVFGPRKLPEIGRTLGKAMVEFRRAAMELRSSIEREINLEELQDTTRSVTREVGEGIRGVADVAQQAIPEEVREIRPSNLLQKLEIPKLEEGQPSSPRTDPRTDDAAKRD